MAAGTPARASLTITDPRSLRALAHPARQVLITELTNGRVLTATEAADLVGLSPSAVSHHLRALEKYGIAERAEPGADADGRTRPWRSRYRELNFTPVGAGASGAAETMIRTHLTVLEEAYAEAVRAGAATSGGHEAGVSVSETWLTDTERLAVLRQFEEVLDRIPQRHSGDHPDGTKRIQFTVAHVPLDGD